MKKLAIVIAAIALIGTPAFAADMARKMPVKAPPPPPPAPVYSWTGLYLGGHVGGVWANVDYTHINNSTPPLSKGSRRMQAPLPAASTVAACTNGATSFWE
jgi:opacity protein-like surface antigen